MQKTILIFILMIVCSGCNNINITAISNETKIDSEFSENLKKTDEFELIDENSHLQLYVKGTTAEIAIKDLASDEWWYSNPQSNNEMDFAIGFTDNLLNSQISLEYMNPKDEKNTYHSFSDSVNYNQYSFKKINNGIRVIYDIGKRLEANLAPKVLSDESYKKISEALSEEEQLDFNNQYIFMNLKDINDVVVKQRVLELYPSLKNDSFYIISNSAGEVTEYAASIINGYLEKSTYTQEDKISDYSKYQIEMPVQKDAVFTVPMDFCIENKNLITKISCENIKKSSEDYTLTEVTVLPGMGAADDKESGYIFVPDGSGALINLNNNKGNLKSYRKKVYGNDHSILLTENSEVNSAKIFLPVFGIKQRNKSIFAIIEEGDALAILNANVSGDSSKYNYTNASFTTTPYFKPNANNINLYSLNSYQKRMMIGDIKIKYCFLSGENSNYIGMANAYQEYLLENNLLRQQTSSGDIPLNIRFIGGLKIKDYFLGFPSKTYKILTTFSEAKIILDVIKNHGVDNANIIYSAWANEGYFNSSYKKLDPAKALGGKSAMVEFNDYCKINGYQFFPQVNMSYFYDDDVFKRMASKKDSAKGLDGEIAVKYRYRITNNMMLKDFLPSYVVSPSKYAKYTNIILSSMKELNINSIAIEDLGVELNSDFNKDDLVDRQQALSLSQNAFGKLRDNKINISAKGANAYAFSYLSNISDAPLYSDNYYLFDQEIPFYSIVIHGILPSSGEPINLSSDIDKTLLRHIETGTNPSYQFIYQNNSELKNTNLHLNSINYEYWVSNVKTFYEKINHAIGDCQNFKIINHNKIADGVFVTEFSNGKKIYVNYNDHKVNIEAITIEPLDYYVVKGGDIK